MEVAVKHALQTKDYLKDVTFFSACTSKELELIARATTRLSFAAGDVLAREGRGGHELMVIVDGEARVSIAGRPIATLSPGECFGEIALLDRGPRTATVTADTALTVEVIGQHEFETLIDGAPHLCRGLLIGLARRLRAADVQLAQSA